MRLITTVIILTCVSPALAEPAEPPAPPTPKFEPQTIDDKIAIGYGVATGEVDGDGHPDILLADAKQIVWYKNPGKPGEPWAKHVMAENLTLRDNVCLAARDIDGDGKVEVAVGAQWNPGETTNTETSGAIFYLIRPADPTQKWESVQIKPHEPTVHRMAWVRAGKKNVWLVVVPLHGRGNRNGQGDFVRSIGYLLPEDPRGEWKRAVIDEDLHMTHNFDVDEGSDAVEPMPTIIIGGKEGFVFKVPDAFMPDDVEAPIPFEFAMLGDTMPGAGEVRWHHDQGWMFAAIEPMHGNTVSLYGLDVKDGEGITRRTILDESLREGHGLASDNLLGTKRKQIVAGWRMPNAEKKVGIRMYVPLDEMGEKWATHVIDDNKMACEDLKVADLDGDGRLDIVASGRMTKNVIVYWNRTEMEKGE